LESSRKPFGLRGPLLAGMLSLSLVLAPGIGASAFGDEMAPVALQSLAPIVKKVQSAVVNISVRERGNVADEDDNSDNNDNDDNAGRGSMPGSPYNDFLRKFFEQQGINPDNQVPQPRVEHMALGSGFIIDPAGYVVTNNHVVEQAAKSP